MQCSVQSLHAVRLELMPQVKGGPLQASDAWREGLRPAVTGMSETLVPAAGFCAPYSHRISW